MSDRDTELALQLLRESPEYVEDAREGAPFNNTVVGSVMNLTHGIPRQYAEAAVRDALELLDHEAGNDDCAPMCPECGYIFDAEPAVGRAYLFLYGGDRSVPIQVDRSELVFRLEEVVLDMGNSSEEESADALAYAISHCGFPLCGDLQSAVLHRQTHEDEEGDQA